MRVKMFRGGSFLSAALSMAVLAVLATLTVIATLMAAS